MVGIFANAFQVIQCFGAVAHHIEQFVWVDSVAHSLGGLEGSFGRPFGQFSRQFDAYISKKRETKIIKATKYLFVAFFRNGLCIRAVSSPHRLQP